MCHMYMTDFAYAGLFFLVPLSVSYAGSPVLMSETESGLLCAKVIDLLRYENL